MSNNANVRNAYDVQREAVGNTLNATGNTNPYDFYEGTLTAGVSPLVIDTATYLGRDATAGYIRNLTDTVTFTAAFSIDGTTYGKEWRIRSDAILDLNIFIAFKKIRLTRVTSDADYEIGIR